MTVTHSSQKRQIYAQVVLLTAGMQVIQVLPWYPMCKGMKHVERVGLKRVKDNGKEKEPNAATIKNLVSGDTIISKAMYKRAKNFTPVMKLIFMLNKLPKIYFTDYSVKRRLHVINFTSIFVDEQKAFDKQQADELRKRGAPECLIQVKDEMYFENHVQGHEQAFLRFLVEGAVAF